MLRKQIVLTNKIKIDKYEMKKLHILLERKNNPSYNVSVITGYALKEVLLFYFIIWAKFSSAKRQFAR